MTDSGSNSHQFQLDDLLAYLDDVVQSFENHPDEATQQAVFGMLQALDAVHREGLKRLAVFLADRGTADLLADAADADRVIYTLLGLYDMLPADPQSVAQVELALTRIRPYIESHGGWLTVLRVDEGVVHVEMGGSCHGCPGSQITLQRGVQRALEEAIPDFAELVVHEPSTPIGVTNGQGFISLAQVQPSPTYLQAPDFQPALALAELPPGKMRQVEVAGAQVLLANVNDEIYAVGAFCPGSMLPLCPGMSAGMEDDAGERSSSPAVVTCPWHREQFDVRDGRCLKSDGRSQTPSLPVYPIAVRQGMIEVAVNVSTRPILAKAAHES
jgi:Fe-S cluster biogenesis protein NfuA/nitrite reductase/ring-hydroxylating ferredoxin subunit